MTYSLLSLMAGFVSFTVVKIYVSFAYYFFVMHRTASKKTAAGFMDTQSEGKRFTFRTLIRLLYANFLAPIFISFLFVHELTGSIVEEYTGMDKETWEVARLGVVLAFMLTRLLTFREEMQFQFDQSYAIIQRMMDDRNP
jgi:hypothetical protein